MYSSDTLKYTLFRFNIKFLRELKFTYTCQRETNTGLS